MPQQIEIKFDLDEVLAGYRSADDEGNGYGPITVQDAIISRAAHMLVERLTRDKDSGYGSLVASVQEQRREMVAEALRPLIEEAINTPAQRTNDWGSPVGEPVSLRDMILDEARKALTVKRERERYGKTSLLQDIVVEEVEKVLKADMAEVAAEARQQVRERLVAAGAGFIADTVEKLAK